MLIGKVIMCNWAKRQQKEIDLMKIKPSNLDFIFPVEERAKRLGKHFQRCKQCKREIDHESKII